MKYLEYQENLKRGSEGFPVSYYHLSPLHPRYHMPPHWHNEYEIIRVLSGELNVNINNRPLVLKKNDTAIINSGFLHSAEPKNGGCYECIVFDMEYFLKQRSSAPELPNELLNRQKLIYDFFPADDFEFSDAFKKISDALVCRTKGYTLIAEGAIISLVGLLMRENKFIEVSQQKIFRNKKSYELKTVLNYIALHYSDHISLNDLADCVHMNPNYFCRFFKTMTQKSPTAYLNYYRIECACEKLCTGNDSVLNIALDCGFSDANYFIKVFKKLKGCTPLQYVNKNASE